MSDARLVGSEPERLESPAREQASRASVAAFAGVPARLRHGAAEGARSGLTAPPPPGVLLALQQAAGNRATGAVLRRTGLLPVRPQPAERDAESTGPLARTAAETLTHTGPEPPKAGTNFTADQVALLSRARAALKPQGTAIVGALIPEGGEPIFLQSGGGQGFFSHVEGKTTAKMRELGIVRAKLIVELEPCQICDRSTYPGPDVPSEGVTGTASGKQIPLQISKINTALPAGTKLTVVGPDSTGIYEGVGPSDASGMPLDSDPPHPDPQPA